MPKVLDLSKLEKREEGHWYTLDGSPKHKVTSSKGEPRNITLADARKLSLVPSVTTILKVVDKPQLAMWMKQQLARACIANPYDGDMHYKLYAKALEDYVWAEVRKTADLGTYGHSALEKYFDGEPIPEELQEIVQPVLAWKDHHQLKWLETEVAMTNVEYGFGGCVDVIFTWGDGKGMGILDYKFKDTIGEDGSPKKKIYRVDEYGMQLAAYAATYFGEDKLADVRLANLIISTTEPGRIELQKWEDPVGLFEAFKGALTIWKYKNKFDHPKA